MNINATLLGQTLAFVIFVVICWRYVWPPIVNIMHEREKRIADGLEAAKKADDALEEAKINYKSELDRAKSEAAEIINKANLRSSQIIAEAKDQAESEAEKIITSANKSLEAEINKTKEALRQELSEIVINATEKILEEEISPDKHEKIILEAAKKL